MGKQWCVKVIDDVDDGCEVLTRRPMIYVILISEENARINWIKAIRYTMDLFSNVSEEKEKLNLSPL